MAARIAFVFLAAILIFHVIMLDATAIRRDVAAQNKTSGQTIDDAVQSIKSGLDDLIKNIQDNELLQNVTHHVKAFGEQVQNHTQQLVQKIQSATKDNN